MKTYNLKEGSIWEREDGATAVGRVEEDWAGAFDEKFWWHNRGKNETAKFSAEECGIIKDYIRSLLNTRMEQHDEDVREEIRKVFYDFNEGEQDFECNQKVLKLRNDVIAIINTSSSLGKINK